MTTPSLLDRLERRFILTLDEAVEELRLGHARDAPRAEEAIHLTNDRTQTADRHRFPLHVPLVLKGTAGLVVFGYEKIEDSKK